MISMSEKALAAECGSRVMAGVLRQLGVKEVILEGLLIGQGLDFFIGCISPVIYTS
jgi:hypothetical protein